MNLENEIVFLRADLNINLQELKSHDPAKLKALLPTLDMLIEKKAKILLATHIGRPEVDEPRKYDEKLSTKQLLPWFEKHGYSIEFATSPKKAYEKIQQFHKQIILLENLRFWPEEKNSNLPFAQELRGSSSYYINDAFATMHRNDTSITLLPTLFDKKHKTIGLRVEKELENLKPLIKNIQKPYTIFLGGGKPSDKIGLIIGLLHHASTIVLCPATCFTFLKAQGKQVGKSLVADDQIDSAREILEKAQEKNVKIIFPADYVVAEDSFDGPLSIVSAENFKSNHVGIATGPKTLETLKPIIENSQTIFFNAAMGALERPESTLELERLLYQVAQSPSYSVIGGGDSVAAANFYKLSDKFSFCSTGGGATLCYISGNDLPGLDALR